MLKKIKQALQKVDSQLYFDICGNEEEKQKLLDLLHKIAKTPRGADIINGLTKNDMDSSYHLVLELRKNPSGVKNGRGQHSDFGHIWIWESPKEEENIEALAHELCHAEQKQNGLWEQKQFTPEQNFIISRLTELDALMAGIMVSQNKVFSAAGIDSLFLGEYTQTYKNQPLGPNEIEVPDDLERMAYYYNFQAMECILDVMMENHKGSKNFDTVREILVHRLNVHLNPASFDMIRLDRSAIGRQFSTEGVLNGVPKIQSKGTGQLGFYLAYNVPQWSLIKWRSKDGRYTIKQDAQGRTIFSDNIEGNALLEIQEGTRGYQNKRVIYQVKTAQNPNGCKSVQELKSVMAELNRHFDKAAMMAFYLPWTEIMTFVARQDKTWQNLKSLSKQDGRK